MQHLTQLPALPHPSQLLTASPHLVAQESRLAFEHQSAFRRALLSDQIDLPSTSPNTLTPLPPIPSPQTVRPPTITPSSRPDSRPKLPSSHPLAREQSIDDCIGVFNDLYEGCHATYKKSLKAIRVDYPMGHAWICLWGKGYALDVRVERFTLYPLSDHIPAIHTTPTSAPHATLSHHLTNLHLTLPELLTS
ncbi:hypothetical protein TREMEDRAFT_58668 [Tremella mesenterica DSM 1558]|uniref:uncharacterized protein n=1 Tax=Tremella mesenterica (strain ATCC 24925 / CBS 8224 / DSM 1558 / NBRC 9311 / NRRL Y-6157 / RJB 2259-6 / UBC 559-6) TaxID=578456 RepID=UPI0003F49A8E|nr:uncharacterized protein TREMEDRAFT_58668 [Tremella mesenterica DSM 1558]EIW72496.1 hypothetical protein TREMEDRAFT_58668 [Tremella mesenterica DSM 1558]